MNLPVLDNRASADIFSSVKKLAKSYTPEWNFFEQEPDFGTSLAKIYGDMTFQTLNMLNRVPNNYYISFLNLLNATIKPAKEATGYITVNVIKNTNGVYLEKGTEIYAAASNETGRIAYETTDGMYADCVEITDIYCTNGKSDSIAKLYSNTDGDEKTFKPFDFNGGENLQQHVLYIKSDVILKTSGKTDIVLYLEHAYSRIFDNDLRSTFLSENVSFQYYGDDEWADIKDVSPYGEKGIRITFADYSRTFDLDGNAGLYLRAILKKLPDNKIYMTDVSLTATGKNLTSDAIIAGGADSPKRDFFPYLPQFSVQDSFYICCNEAFYKKGASVTMNFDMQFMKIPPTVPYTYVPPTFRNVMKKSDFEMPEPDDIQIDSVVWEYFNGRGWVRLFGRDRYGDFFTGNSFETVKRSISFICPEDMIETSEGGYVGYFLRARIVRVRNPYSPGGVYISPFVSDISISYEYENTAVKISDVTIFSNMENETVALPSAGTEPIFKQVFPEEPTMFLKLSKPIDKGPLRIFFDIEPNSAEMRPALKWEYPSSGKTGVASWESFDVIDMTGNFANSGTVITLGRTDFLPVHLFGTDGYFIRLKNVGGEYGFVEHHETLPQINGIFVNTVPVIQKNTGVPEYFFLQAGEKDQKIKLAFGNVNKIELYNDEKGFLSPQEEEKYLENPETGAIPEYNSIGELYRLWIPWQKTENLSMNKSDDRAYELESASGEITFGNGISGRVPYVKNSEALMVRYSTSEGETGNILPGEILGFTGAIQNIENVTNHKEISGGVNTETTEQAARRMAVRLSSLDKLVTISDYEDILPAFDRSIKSVKCVPHVNKYNKKHIGTLSIAVLPVKFMRGYENFAVIKKNIEAFIKDHSVPFSMFNIFEVNYVEISVDAKISINDYNDYHQICTDIRLRLKDYIDPILGNFNKKGFEIGVLPNEQTVYNCIKGVKNIKFIQRVDLNAKVVTSAGAKEIDIKKASADIFAVPVLGKVEINEFID